MAKTTYSKAELTALIHETQKQVRDLLKSEDAAAIAKNENCSPAPMAKDEDKKDGPPPKKDESSDSSSSPPPSDDSPSAPPADDKSSAAPPADSSAPPAPGPDASAPPPAADPSAPAASADPAASATPADSVESLKAAYAQLPPEALKCHWMALKEVIAAQVQASASAAAPVAPAPVGATPPAPVAPAAAAPVAPPPAAPIAPPVADASAPLPAEGTAPVTDELAMKNEKELNEKVAVLEKSLNTVTKAFELLMRKPERKAIRGKDMSLVKAEPVAVDVVKLSAPELAKKLAEVAKNPELKKSDRELINGYFNKRVKAEALQVLFEKK